MTPKGKPLNKVTASLRWPNAARAPLPLFIAASFLLAGCGFLSSKPSKFYSLDRIPSQGSVATVSGLPIGIDLVLPPGLDRKEIVVRKADHQLEVRGREQWTASLEALVLHTLAFDVAGRLPDGMVILPGQAKPDGTMRALDVVIEELAPGPQRVVILDARWTLRDSVTSTSRANRGIDKRAPIDMSSSSISGREHIAIDIESLDSAAIATGTSRALASLADRIVAQLNAAAR